MRNQLYVYSSEFNGDDPMHSNATKQLQYHGNVSSGKCLAEVFHRRCFEVHGIKELVIGEEMGTVPKRDLLNTVQACSSVLENGGLIISISSVT